MKIAIGNDHGGLELKKLIVEHLEKKGEEVKDFGTYDASSCDYPDFAEKVAEAVVSKEFDFGILICGTGIGISIAANKVPGVRAAHLTDTFSARSTKEHNDANIICLGERVTGPGLALDIVDAYMAAEYQGGRHQGRIDKISEIERKYSK